MIDDSCDAFFTRHVRPVREMEPNKLLEALRESVSDITAGSDKAAVAWSGGLDSSVIEALARETLEVTCYLCAIRGASDWKLAQDMRHSGREDIEVLEISRPDMLRLVPRAADILGSVRPVEIAYSIPIIRVLEESKQGLVLAGSGADELFGGYAKYEAMDDPREAMRADFEKMLRESERLDKAARAMNKTLRFPFAAENVVRLASALPTRDLIGPGGRKLVLREVAIMLGLASHDRPKKAAQYSSGIMREMERLAKKDGLSISEWTETTAGATRATD